FPNPAYPEGAGPDFLNMVLTGRTALSPNTVLAALLAIEAQHGRLRAAIWEARPIDIDLLSYGDLVSDGFWAAAARGDVPPDPPPFILPPPRLHFRRFVLEPLEKIAPEWRHPALGMTARALRAQVPGA